jgi:hypothetical protein
MSGASPPTRGRLRPLTAALTDGLTVGLDGLTALL